MDFVLNRRRSANQEKQDVDPEKYSDRNSNTSKELSEKLDTLKDWINQHSKGEEGFTALHFAAFHGNMKNIRLLMKYGANVHAKNK